MTDRQSGVAMTTGQRMTSLRDMLELAAPKMQAVMPDHMSAEKMIRIASLAISRTPALLECTPISVVTSVMLAARLGLAPDGALGSAYLVPFFNKKIGQKECQLIPGYRGFIDLARRSGEVRKVETRLAYPVDTLEIDYGAERPIVHRPDLRASEPGDWFVVWAMATFIDGTVQVELMTRDQVMAIRNRAKAKYGPWVDDFDEMARKTVVRRLAKYLPLSPELAAASLLQAGAEAGRSTVIDAAQTLDIDLTNDVPQIEGRSKADEIADAIAGEPDPEPTPEPKGAPVQVTDFGSLLATLTDAADEQAAADIWSEHAAMIEGLEDAERATLNEVYDSKGRA